MRFPLLNRLTLPCVLERLIPGQPHPDGRRYLPLVVLRPTGGPADGPSSVRIGVVDRHHRVRESQVGRGGAARLVCSLGVLRRQEAPPRRGLVPESGWTPPRASLAPTFYGRVVEIITWETERGMLPYETLYAELLLDIGLGTVGLRTGATADDLTSAFGRARLEPGDAVELARSRIDILEFEPVESAELT
ncbi:MAG: hypothetical protein SNJ69_15995 [Chloroflexaceae bacterium]